MRKKPLFSHFIWLNAILLLVVLIISGCAIQPQSQVTPPSSSSSPDPNSTHEPIQSAENTPVPTATIPVELSSLKDVEIRVIHPWTGESGKVASDLIAQFNAENIWGITVREVISGSASETSRLFLEEFPTSDRINLVVIPPEYLSGWIDSSMVIDLNPYIENPEWGLTEQQVGEFLPQAWNANSFDSQQIGIPAQVNLQFLVYNRTWAAELGFIDSPRTQDEFIQQVCAAARANNQDNQKENDGTGGWIINNSSQSILSWINAFEGSNAWNSGKAPDFNQVETGAAFTYLREMFQKGCAWNSRVASPFTYFSNRQSLAFSATLPDLLELEKTMDTQENMDDWIIIPYPGTKRPSNGLMTGLSYGISKTNPTSQLASWLFLRWMILQRNQVSLSEASGTLPASKPALDIMEPFAKNHPWLQTAYEMLPAARMIPSSPELRQIRPVLEDSMWQMLQPTPLPIPTLLEQMDETIKSIPQ